MKDFELGKVAAVETAITAEQPTTAQLGVRADQEIANEPLPRAARPPVNAPQFPRKIRARLIERIKSNPGGGHLAFHLGAGAEVSPDF